MELSILKIIGIVVTMIAMYKMLATAAKLATIRYYKKQGVTTITPGQKFKMRSDLTDPFTLEITQRKGLKEVEAKVSGTLHFKNGMAVLAFLTRLHMDKVKDENKQ